MRMVLIAALLGVSKSRRPFRAITFDVLICLLRARCTIAVADIRGGLIC